MAEYNKKFAEGIIAKRGSEKAHWVLCKLSLKREEVIKWLQSQDGEWLNLEVSKSDKAKYGASIYLDEYKPDPNYKAPAPKKETEDIVPDAMPDYGEYINPDDIPF